MAQGPSGTPPYPPCFGGSTEQEQKKKTWSVAVVRPMRRDYYTRQVCGVNPQVNVTKQEKNRSIGWPL